MQLTSRKMRRLIHGIALGSDPHARDPRTRRAKPVRELKREHGPWWEHPNVVGLCLGRRMQQGILGEPVLQVFVRRKTALASVRARNRIPREVDGSAVGIRGRVPTDVRAVGSGRLDVLVRTERPILPGYNVGGRRSGSGTLTCAVRSRDTGEMLGLSCSHVLARYGLASPGERVLAPAYATSLSNDYPQAPLGTLVTVVPLSFDDDASTGNVDAATFRPDAASDLDVRLGVLGSRPEVVRSDVPLDLPVRKVGFTTELTYGVVQALHVLVTLPYPHPDGGTEEVLFADQIGVSSFTQAGDSGALVLDGDGAAVGMHFASFEGMSVCTPMRKVLDAVGCDLA